VAHLVSSVLGCFVRDDTLYATVVAAERTGQCVIDGFYHSPCSDATLGTAIAEIVAASQVRAVAWALAPDAAFIEPFPHAAHLLGRQRRAAARSFAEVDGFTAVDPVQAIVGRSGVHYIAAARFDVLDRIAGAVRSARARLVWAEAEAYAWARVLPDHVSALVSFGTYNIRAIALADEAAWCRVFPRERPDRDVLAEIGAYLTQLELEGLASIGVVAVDGDTDLVRHHLGGRNRVWDFATFEFDVGVEHARWAPAAGIGWSALTE
jgi:hypothetical protein